jgi:hypothetical protein
MASDLSATESEKSLVQSLAAIGNVLAAESFPSKPFYFVAS